MKKAVTYILKTYQDKIGCPCKSSAFRYWVNSYPTNQQLIIQSQELACYEKVENPNPKIYENAFLCKNCGAKWATIVNWGRRDEPLIFEALENLNLKTNFPDNTDAKVLSAYYPDQREEAWVEFMLNNIQCKKT